MKTKREILSILLALKNIDGLPANQIAYITNIKINRVKLLLDNFILKGYVRTEKYAAHRYYCLNKNKDIFNKWDNQYISKTLLSLKKLHVNKIDEKLKFARICYRHLAGILAIELIKCFLVNGFIFAQDNNYYLTLEGKILFSTFFKIDIEHKSCLEKCLDWTERKYHLSGTFAKDLTSKFFELQWLKYAYKNSRIVMLTEKGQQNFLKYFNFRFEG